MRRVMIVALALAGCGGETKAEVPEGGACGNTVKDGAERCDAADLGGATCVSLGKTGGTLGCRSDCFYDTTQCTGAAAVCGDAVQDGGEECDGPDLNNNLTCDDNTFNYNGTEAVKCLPTCIYDLSMCTGAPGDCTDADANEESRQCDGNCNGTSCQPGFAGAQDTCVELGYAGGTLGCNMNCSFNVSGCTQ